jgi:DNA polymerase-3 subunit epsilon
LTGNELIALILESQEIRRLWPKYNQAQKFRVEEWGIYDYEDRNGYLRFSVNVVTRGSRPLIRFSSKGEAWNFLWEKVRQFELCPKLSGLQVAKGLCFDYQSGGCHGGCMGVEHPAVYNLRIEQAISSFHDAGETVAIIGRGRNIEEQSLVLVENGVYVGFGFCGREAAISDFESAKIFVKRSAENRTVQNLINSYISNPRGSSVVVFDGV